MYLKCAAKSQLDCVHDRCDGVVDVESTYKNAANHLRETENGIHERQSEITAINKLQTLILN